MSGRRLMVYVQSENHNVYYLVVLPLHHGEATFFFQILFFWREDWDDALLSLFAISVSSICGALNFHGSLLPYHLCVFLNFNLSLAYIFMHIDKGGVNIFLRFFIFILKHCIGWLNVSILVEENSLHLRRERCCTNIFFLITFLLTQLSQIAFVTHVVDFINQCRNFILIYAIVEKKVKECSNTFSSKFFF